MAKTATEAKAKTEPTATPPAPKVVRWKPSYRFVEYRGRKMVIKLVDPENGFQAGRTVMTMNGPAADSHAHSISIDKDGYSAKNEKEEAALLKLAQLPNGHFKGGSLLVLWENREMPPEQRKAELSAADFRKRVDDLEAQLADKPQLEEENRLQAATIAQLEAQLAAKQGG